MAAEQDKSPSGAPFFRHQARDRGIEFAAGDEESIELISEHIGQHIGPGENVFHEIVSDMVHVDIHVVNPTPKKNYYTLVTSGMSDRPMAAPEENAELRFAELVLCLPPTWQLNQEAYEDERNYWPLRWLKILARLPHEHQTWLWATHTVPNGDPPEPFADDTKLCGVLLMAPILFGDEFLKLQMSPEKTVYFLSVIPLYREEMDLKLNKGLDPLLDKLGPAGVTELLDISRKNVCKKRFGLF